MKTAQLPVDAEDRTLDQRTTVDPLPRWKRGVDLVGASLGLLLLSPVLLCIAVVIKLVSRGPVLFRHKRYGYRGGPLYVWKFRSMHANTDPDEHQQYVIDAVQKGAKLVKLDNDARIIPFGKWLRSTAIDEIPQLLNVLSGEMSLVGPRPDVVPVEEYETWQRVRFEVMPGLTGLWQVSGKNHTTFEEENQLDATYVAKRSFWFDLKIMLLTIPAICRQVAEERLFKHRTN